MKEWLMARSPQDTQKFYDEKYAKDGYFVFCCGDWERAIQILEGYGGVSGKKEIFWIH